jgi:dsRNA-specific ribonuclease
VEKNCLCLHAYARIQGFKLLTHEHVCTYASRVGREQGLDEYLQVSLKEERRGGRRQPNALADAVESIIAAVYIDQVMHECICMYLFT